MKLCDFGFAKIDQGDLMTPQFTPYYVAPQVRLQIFELTNICFISKINFFVFVLSLRIRIMSNDFLGSGGTEATPERKVWNNTYLTNPLHL